MTPPFDTMAPTVLAPAAPSRSQAALGAHSPGCHSAVLCYHPVADSRHAKLFIRGKVPCSTALRT